MSQGIGIRYSGAGLRALAVEKSDDGFHVCGLAAGNPGRDVHGFLSAAGISLENGTIAYGLCPGEFLTASLPPRETLMGADLRAQLRWEIERKMVTDKRDFRIDFSIADLGFVFAGKKDLIVARNELFGPVIADVEPVALFNGCDMSSEITNGVVMLVSAEAEGISSVLLVNGELMAMESFIIKEQPQLASLASVDRNAIDNMDGGIVDKLAGYICDSAKRVGGNVNGTEIMPDVIMLSGCAACVDGLAGKVQEKSEVETSVSDPYSAFAGDVRSQYSDYADTGAAFVTCLGLAVRALEE